MKLVSQYDRASDQSSTNRALKFNAKSAEQEAINISESMAELFFSIDEDTKENIEDVDTLIDFENQIRDKVTAYSQCLQRLKFFREECKLNNVDWRED